MRSRLLLPTLALFVVASAHCGGPSVQRTMPVSWVGTDRARLAAYMSYGDAREDVPPGVPHEAVRDEVVLTKSAGGETCFHVVERTSQNEDEPIDELRPHCEVNGTDADAVVGQQTVATQDYPYVASTDRFNAHGYNPVNGMPFSFSLKGKPEERVFRVVERSAEVCCPGSGRRIELGLKSSRMSYNNAAYKQSFAWDLQ